MKLESRVQRSSRLHGSGRLELAGWLYIGITVVCIAFTNCSTVASARLFWLVGSLAMASFSAFFFLVGGHLRVAPLDGPISPILLLTLGIPLAFSKVILPVTFIFWLIQSALWLVFTFDIQWGSAIIYLLFVVISVIFSYGGSKLLRRSVHGSLKGTVFADAYIELVPEATVFRATTYLTLVTLSVIMNAVRFAGRSLPGLYAPLMDIALEALITFVAVDSFVTILREGWRRKSPSLAEIQRDDEAKHVPTIHE